MDNRQNLIIGNILASLPVGIAVIDSTGSVVFTNPALSLLLGYTDADFRRQGWGPLLFHNARNDDFNQVVVDAIQQESVNLTREVFYDPPEGGRKRLAITTSFLRDGGEVAGVVVLVEDVSEAYEAHLREKEFMQEQHRVELKRVESMRKLALSVAHQIRNPVMSIGGFAALAQRRLSVDDRLQSYLATIIDEARRLEEVVKAVHEYAALPLPSPVPTSLTELVRAARRILEARAAELKRAFVWRESLASVELAVDPALMAEALGALLVNALEFSPGERPEIRLEARNTGARLELTVIDRGRGIAAADLPYVFDPFFTTKARGVGLGLPKARRIVEEHHGAVSLSSTPGAGTTVTVSLPLAPPGASDATGATAGTGA
jgi:PAS domain S-box-containing protein